MLSLKDIYAALLGILTIGVYYAFIKGITIPLIAGYRWGVVILAIVGILMCAIGNNNTINKSDPFIFTASFMGAAAVIFIILGLITGSKVSFTLLSFDLIGLWILTTSRHFLVK